MNLKNHFITTSREYTEGAVELFSQTIAVSGIKSATLKITALGVYEAEINGKKAGDRLFAPGFTYYPDHLYYQSYDVTDMLREGENTLCVFLGQGWYAGRFTFENKNQIYGSSPAVSWELTLTDNSGTSTYFSDDENVKTEPSQYVYAGFYDGEIYNENSGTEVFQKVKFEGHIPENIEESILSVRIREQMPIKSVTVRGDSTIIDFGQNFAGIISIDPTKMRGQVLKLRHGEILNPDGSLYTANLRKAKAEIVYHKSESDEIYRPRFTYMGFRYAELSGVPYEDGLITAHAIYSDMERVGDFTCENPLVDRLFKNQVWGQKSNYIEVPTDCPQRDERMGYTGDGQVFAKTGAYNFDTEKFWAKFLRDIRYSQNRNKLGYVAPTIPAPPGEQGVGFMSMLGWGNCICIIPELLYHHFGKDSYVREYYDSMKKFVDLEISKMGGIFGKKNLWVAPSLGDWLAMGRDVKYMAMHNGPVSNAFIVNDLRIMIWASELLCKNEDTVRYKEQLEKTREAYIKAFIKKDGTMRDDYQGAYIMALKMVVPRGELWHKIYNKLIEKLRRDGMQTGFFATEYILPLLADNGDESLAFDLLLSPKLGGWMYQVERGATTTWERWDALRPDGSVNESKMSSDNMVSFNHYSFGSVGEFYYEYILGIKPLAPGFKKVQIKPFIDSRIGAFKGAYRGINVEYDNSSLHISTNKDAKIILPDGREFEKCAGEYTFLIGGKDEKIS